MHRFLPKRFHMSSGFGHVFRGVLLLAILGLFGCTSLPFGSGSGSSSGQTPGALTPAMLPDDGYGLEPGDVVRISVWREEALDQGVLVRPDGGISFPLAGELNAEGKTIGELSDEIAQRLSEFIPSPVVTVSLQQNEGNRIYVTGRVNQPGVFLINRPVDVMQALSMAGGLTPFADKDAIQVLRRQGNTQVTIPFDYQDVQKGQDLRQNILLQAGDTLIVP